MNNLIPLTYAERFYAEVSTRGGTAIGVYVNSAKKVEIKCKNGHLFMMTPSHYKKGHGCPKCAGLCPEQAKESFHALLKTNGETSQSPYVDVVTKIEIICKNGHLFTMRPNDYKKGRGCKECHLNKRFPNRATKSLSTIGRTLISPPE